MADIFDKPAQEPVKKPRKLTEKQLENLAKGRAKMAERRGQKPAESKPAESKPAESKPVETMDKAMVKLEREAVKEQKTQRKTAKKEEKQQLKAIDKADDIIAKNKLANFKDVTVSFMEKCETPEQIKLLKKVLARYTKDDIADDAKLKQKIARDLTVIREHVNKNK